MMSAQTTSELGTRVQLKQPYEVALARTKAALKVEGFGVLTEIDVQETMKQKLGVDFRRYIILGACNPPLAHRALSADLSVGLLLPCNVVVYETAPGESEVGLLNPMIMSTMFTDPAFAAIAQDAQQRLDRVAASLRE
jgi:uncharacterized protein (DUF302 family)